jgi:hypothetical protein
MKKVENDALKKYGSSRAWIGFSLNFIGFIAAITILMIQMLE